MTTARTAASPQLPLFAVRRSERARRARLTVTETGDALVVLPARASEHVAAELVARHHAWLDRHRRRILAERQHLAARPALAEGRLITLRGVGHVLVVEAGARRARSTVRVAEGAPPSIVVSGADATGRVVERWLRAQARRDISAAVSRRGAEMGMAPARVSVRDQRTRWGSASGNGTLSFSWRLVLCPPDVLDYVVVHELAHLRWRGHGARFWGLVERFMPNAADHRRWLRLNHRQLQAALD